VKSQQRSSPLRESHMINLPKEMWSELKGQSGNNGLSGANGLIEKLCEEFLASEREKKKEAAAKTIRVNVDEELP
jgi:hypothetical protein